MFLLFGCVSCNPRSTQLQPSASQGHMRALGCGALFWTTHFLQRSFHKAAIIFLLSGEAPFFRFKSRSHQGRSRASAVGSCGTALSTKTPKTITNELCKTSKACLCPPLVLDSVGSCDLRPAEAVVNAKLTSPTPPCQIGKPLSFEFWHHRSKYLRRRASRRWTRGGFSWSLAGLLIMPLLQGAHFGV